MAEEKPAAPATQSTTAATPGAPTAPPPAEPPKQTFSQLAAELRRLLKDYTAIQEKMALLDGVLAENKIQEARIDRLATALSILTALEFHPQDQAYIEKKTQVLEADLLLTQANAPA